jgi:hypothetical protein
MKKILLATFVLIILSFSLESQVVENSGKPIAEIYTNFHYNLTQDSLTSGFALNRAYFGYNYFATKTFSALIKIEIGNPTELAPGSISRRYAYYREASITYAKDKLNISFGVTGTRLFDYQQKFWGKRYIANTFQSLNGYGFVADMGIVADYKFNDIIEADITLMNGEGYSSMQLDNNLKPSLGFTITPGNGLVLRMYSDLIRTDGLWQSTSVAFIGYKNEKINIGGEVNYKSNIDLNDGHNAWGFSCTGAVKLTQNIEIFTRFDYSSLEFIPEAGSLFYLANEGIFIIPGIQYTFNKYVQIALDYQTTMPSNISKQNSNLIFLNTVFKF